MEKTAGACLCLTLASPAACPSTVSPGLAKTLPRPAFRSCFRRVSSDGNWTVGKTALHRAEKSLSAAVCLALLPLSFYRLAFDALYRTTWLSPFAVCSVQRPASSVAYAWIDSVAWCATGTIHGISVIDALASLTTFAQYRQLETRQVATFHSLLLCFVMWFGGGTTLALLTQQVPSWTLSSASILGFFLAWAVMFMTPGDAFYRSFTSWWVQLPVAVFDAVCIAQCISIRGVENVVTFSAAHGAPHSRAFCLVASLISGAGGGLVLEVAGAWPKAERQVATGTPYGLNRIIILAPLYLFVLRERWSPDEGSALLAVLLLTSNLTFAALEVDVFAPLVYGPLRLLGVEAVVQPSLVKEPPALLSPIMTPKPKPKQV